MKKKSNVSLAEKRYKELLAKESIADSMRDTALVVAPHRVQILNKGAALTSGDRDKTYGNPHSNMVHMAAMLTSYFSHSIVYDFTAEDAAIIMVLAKLSRLKANKGTPYHEDNYIDAATYTAMAGASRKIQEEERNSLN